MAPCRLFTLLYQDESVKREKFWLTYIIYTLINGGRNGSLNLGDFSLRNLSLSVI
jgi:hypothetical protein